MLEMFKMENSSLIELRFESVSHACGCTIDDDPKWSEGTYRNNLDDEKLTVEFVSLSNFNLRFVFHYYCY